MRHSRQRVSLSDAVLVGNVLVASGERNGLERDGLHLVNIFGGKFNDAADALVVPGINDGRDERHLDADRSEILNGF